MGPRIIDCTWPPPAEHEEWAVGGLLEAPCRVVVASCIWVALSVSPNPNHATLRRELSGDRAGSAAREAGWAGWVEGSNGEKGGQPQEHNRNRNRAEVPCGTRLLKKPTRCGFPASPRVPSPLIVADRWCRTGRSHPRPADCSQQPAERMAHWRLRLRGWRGPGDGQP